MNNFEFRNPTKIIFGKGKIAELSSEIKKGLKIMITYGGGSIFKNGVYEQVKNALDGYSIVEFGGIEANPDYNTLINAVEICKTEKVDIIIAVGGGSVIDGTKFIASAVKYNGDAWDFMTGKATAIDALPFATVLTLPATGSEMNCGAVISRREYNEKYSFMNHVNGYPQFSILDPETIYSLPAKQVANGVVDTYAHTLEQYLTTSIDNRVMDRWAEGLLLTLIEIAPRLLSNDKDYNTCANFMITATTGLNGFIAMGVDEDWATHMIGHEITALHGLDHGASLAIVYPGMMSVMREPKKAKLCQYAERVWNITEGTDDEKINAAISCTEDFFKSLGLKIKLSDHAIGVDTINEIANRFTARKWKLGENQLVTVEKVREILTHVL